MFPPGNSLAVAQNGPAPPTSSALTIIRLFRVVIESSNVRAARFASVGFQRASRVLGSVEADVLNHRNDGSGTFCPAPSLTTKAAPISSTDHGAGNDAGMPLFSPYFLSVSQVNFAGKQRAA
jgi:hypothetical protein